MVNVDEIYSILQTKITPNVNIKSIVILTASEELGDALKIEIVGGEASIEGLDRGHDSEIFAGIIIHKLIHINDRDLHFIKSNVSEFAWKPNVKCLYEKCETYYDEKKKVAAVRLLDYDGKIEEKYYKYREHEYSDMNGWVFVWNETKAHRILLGKIPGTKTAKKVKPLVNRIEYTYLEYTSSPSVRSDGIVILPSPDYNNGKGNIKDAVYIFTEIVEDSGDLLIVRIHKYDNSGPVNKTYTFRIEAGKITRKSDIKIDMVKPLDNELGFEQNPYNTKHHPFLPDPVFKTNLVYVTQSLKTYINVDGVWIYLPDGLKEYWVEMGITEPMLAEIEIYKNISRI